ncbi:hypothetical protein [Rhodobium gokarnense]|uniref:Uncharacterized protein n=1 Tax=Rhodobium gokarnense TaxID=364296 RepID=A0ABT3HFS7_9HYPH|nr:hypothetical protein [Rhodobium gokarnense]MCW2309121.1 hypothetical protein [Rhodobium gokarnense]
MIVLRMLPARTLAELLTADAGHRHGTRPSNVVRLHLEDPATEDDACREEPRRSAAV